MEKEHWLLLLRPGEVEPRKNTVLLRDTVLETALVESHGWEIRKTRMHAVLNLKPNWPDAQAYKSLEQTLVEAGLRSLFYT